MQKSFIATASFLTAALLATNAQAFEFGKPATLQATVTKNGATTDAKKDVKVMSIKLSSKELNILTRYTPKHTLSFKSAANYPTSVNLGMNDVPVLDQGMHGSCVTFAVTAALDALVYKKDYISQLCSLSIGTTLENESYLPSGWSGSLGNYVLDQVVRFGIVAKDKESTQVCGGLSAYPTKDWFEEGTGITPKAYKEISENVADNFAYIQLMDPIARFENQFNDKDKAELVFNQVKASLAKGNRVLFGIFLQMSPYCGAAACGTRNKLNDTWILSDQLDLPPSGFGGHEMVIIGYDDNASVYDRTGKQHRGLLTLRNSWGEEVGDKGNYYMSYDYFKKFVMEAYEIRAPKNFIY